MTATFAITPTGGSTLELLARAVTDTTGIFLDSEGNDGLLPVVAYDEEYVSSSDTEGEHRVRSRPQNPQRSGQVLIVANDETTFAARLSTWQQTIEQARRNGGVITFNAPGGATVTCDLESIYTGEIPLDGPFLGGLVARWQFTYVCHPYGRLPEVTIVSGLRSSLPVISVELPNIPGSVTALGRLTVTDLAAQTRDFVEWGLDATYDPANPTPVLLDTSLLDRSGYSGSLTGIVDTYYSAQVLSATLISQPSAICGLGRQTSTGYRRVRVRVRGNGSGPIWVRLGWWLGEKNASRTTSTATGWVGLPGLGAFYDLDLGLVNIPVGQVWGGQIEAYSGTPGDLLYLDIAELIPAARYGKIRAPLDSFVSTGSAIAFDAFTGRAGVLTGNALSLGGTWQGAGDTDDFNLTGSRTITRAATGDAGAFPYQGRIVTGSAISIGAFAVSLDFSTTAVGANQGVIARYVDINNFVAVYVQIAASGQSTLFLYVRSGGSFLIGPTVLCGYLTTNTWYTLAAVGDSSGNVFAWLAPAGSPLDEPILRCATGFVRTGSVGILDNYQFSAASTRTYRNFIVPSVPLANHAIQSGKALRVLADSVSQQPASGTAWTRPPYYSGAYLTVPPGESRLAVKCRRTDDDAWIDSGLTDSTQIDVAVTPRVALI